MSRDQHHRGVRVAQIPPSVALICFLLALADGAAGQPTSTTWPAVTRTTSQSPSPTPTGGLSSSWDFIRANEWIAVPVIAAIGWINTWLIAACRYKGDSGWLADRRYTGLAKRTLCAAFLADDETATPDRVVGCATLDPGLSSQLDDLHDPDCHAGFVSYASWVVQLAAVIYAIVLACIFWVKESSLGVERGYEEFPQLLAVLNVNRGTWALAILGSILPYRRRMWLIGTTVIAVAIEIVFIIRAFLMAAYIASRNQTSSRWGIALAYVLPALEASVFCFGAVAAIFRVKYLPVIVFLFPAMWLVLGPLIIIGLSVLMHWISVNSTN